MALVTINRNNLSDKKGIKSSMIKYSQKLMQYIGFCFTVLFICNIQAKENTQDIEINQGYVRATLPGINLSSAYMQIVNNSNQDIRFIGAKSSVSPKIEIHEHSMENGLMRMRQVSAIAIKKGEQVTLMPYGFHLMIFGLNKPLKDGETIDLTLQFSGHADVLVSLPVESIKKRN
jgi:hypothetical protein